MKGRHAIKSAIWRNISRRSQPIDLGKDWWLWLFVLGVIVFLMSN